MAASCSTTTPSRTLAVTAYLLLLLLLLGYLPCCHAQNTCMFKFKLPLAVGDALNSNLIASQLQRGGITDVNSYVNGLQQQLLTTDARLTSVTAQYDRLATTCRDTQQELEACSADVQRGGARCGPVTQTQQQQQQRLLDAIFNPCTNGAEPLLAGTSRTERVTCDALSNPCPDPYRCVTVTGTLNTKVVEFNFCCPQTTTADPRVTQQRTPSQNGGRSPQQPTSSNQTPAFPPGDACAQPADPGGCPGALLRWFYNKNSNLCEEIIYGGCDGNDNNFRSFADCEQRCGSRQADPGHLRDPGSRCSSAPDHGPCNFNFHRWYFDHQRSQCSQFLYGGCSGNDNRFITQVECQRACQP
ncbi:PREDICTED: papilin-like [Priapulus caudatus]|uniref:Papilin-like n=1 Tax=Priapulus caudatus TaxID=37621 RepID=A0ABM1EJR9_PRICU|nr:PREDICTED: papilin-like [Priapulus caudatus]